MYPALFKNYVFILRHRSLCAACGISAPCPGTGLVPGGGSAASQPPARQGGPCPLTLPSANLSVSSAPRDLSGVWWDDFGFVAYMGDTVMILSNHPRQVTPCQDRCVCGGSLSLGEDLHPLGALGCSWPAQGSWGWLITGPVEPGSGSFLHESLTFALTVKGC